MELILPECTAMIQDFHFRRTLVSIFCVGLLTTLPGAVQAVPLSTGPEMVHTSDAGIVLHNGVRHEDEIVVVNVRTLCGICDPQSMRQGVTVENYAARDETGRRRWQRWDLDSLLASDPSVPTIIFVHGNQITTSDAREEGLVLYRRMMRYGAGGPRIRLVVFSWPSARVGGLLRDVRVKAARTGPAACQLAWLVDQMPAETPISLVGFSFGARIITGGLHILGGGNLGHIGLSERVNPNRPPMNVVLLPAGVHAHWLGEGQYHGLAMTQVNQMFLVNNRRDPAMRFYHLAFRGRPQALGLRGPTCLSSAERSKITMRDVSRYVSRHDLYQYLCVPGVPGHIWDSATGVVPAGQAQVAIAR
jgi:hypothetical protein